MPTYLERYTQGEYEAVWQELQQLGRDVRQEGIYDDALAVARATMQRVRANVETVYARLKTLEFRFGGQLGAYTPPPADIEQRIAKIEKSSGILPLSLKAWYEIVGGVNFVGDHPRLATYEPEPVETNTKNPKDTARWFALTGKLSGRFDAFIRKNHANNINMTFEEAKRIFAEKYAQEYEEVARLSRTMNQGSPPVICSDPLVVDLPPAVDAGAEIWEDFLTSGDESGVLSCAIAPDIFHKANTSGGASYTMLLGNPNVDGILENERHETTFVNYLRISFNWGGFAGFETIEAPPEIAILSEGLLPF